MIDPFPSFTTRPLPSFLPDGRVIVTADGRRADREGGERSRGTDPRVLPDRGSVFRYFGARPRRAVSSGFNGEARVWDPKHGSQIEAIRDPDGSTRTFVLPSPNERSVAAGTFPGPIVVSARGPSEAIGTIPSVPDDEPGFRIWSPDSALITVMHLTTAVLWRVHEGALERIAAVEIGPPPVPPDTRQLLFSPDSTKLVVVREGDGTATMFSTKTGRRMRVFPRARSGRCPRRVQPGQPNVGRVRSRPARPSAAAGRVRRRYRSPTRRTHLARSGRLGGDCSRRQRFVRRANNGALTASVITIYDLASLEAVGEPFEFEGFSGPLSSSADGRRVVHGWNRDFAVIWDIDPDLWAAKACAIAGRSLTEQEWKHYLPGRPYDPACA